MRALILSSLVTGAVLLNTLPAFALTARPAIDAGGGMAPTLIAQGCGIQFHRGPHGFCRPNVFRGGYRYGYYRPRYYGGYARHWGF